MSRKERITEIERTLTKALARENCDSMIGCSALANVLLEAFVRCRRDPTISASVSDEMKRLASHIVRLADADTIALTFIVDEGRLH
jgi:hypothetical protein